MQDAEAKLVAAMTKEEFPAGDTIRSDIRAGSHARLIEKRTIAIFQYYNNRIKG